MPGRSPHEAIEAYIAPLQQAVSCLRQGAKIRRDGRVLDVGDEGVWVLNGADGLTLGRNRGFTATQRFRLVKADPARHDPSLGRYRVTTTMYSYSFYEYGQQVWRMDWHPQRENETRPHMHVADNPDVHIPTGRQSLEYAVEACINFGVIPTRDDWRACLDMSQGQHELYRSWTDHPGELRG